MQQELRFLLSSDEPATLHRTRFLGLFQHSELSLGQLLLLLFKHVLVSLVQMPLLLLQPRLLVPLISKRLEFLWQTHSIAQAVAIKQQARANHLGAEFTGPGAQSGVQDQMRFGQLDPGLV